MKKSEKLPFCFAGTRDKKTSGKTFLGHVHLSGTFGTLLYFYKFTNDNCENANVLISGKNFTKHLCHSQFFL